MNWLPLELGVGVWVQKLEWWGYRAEQEIWRYLQLYGYNRPTWQTDKQTDRRSPDDSKDRAMPSVARVKLNCSWHVPMISILLTVSLKNLFTTKSSNCSEYTPLDHAGAHLLNLACAHSPNSLKPPMLHRPRKQAQAFAKCNILSKVTKLISLVSGSSSLEICDLWWKNYSVCGRTALQEACPLESNGWPSAVLVCLLACKSRDLDAGRVARSLSWRRVSLFTPAKEVKFSPVSVCLSVFFLLTGTDQIVMKC